MLFIFIFVDCACIHMTSILAGAYSGSEKEDSECEEICGSPRMSRRKNRNHSQHSYADTLPEVICHNKIFSSIGIHF